MEDLGEVVENFVETFSCTEESSTRLPDKAVPATHGNLLAASSLYGHLFAAVGSTIVVYSHESLRKGKKSPVSIVDLKEEHVAVIHALALGSHATIIAHVTTTSGRSVVILNISALAAGKIHALPGPPGDVRAFSVRETPSKGTSQLLAALHEECVQLHALTANGATPTTKIGISNGRCIALSPEDALLAVGTERGSVAVYNTKTGDLCATAVEVESGWVPFAMHFADKSSVLVSYNCEAEVRHVVWQLSSDGTAVTGHSPLGEICLAFLPLGDDGRDEAPLQPMITCISLQDWSMCVIGSSMSSDVEIVRKTDGGWEVWKFDEGKIPTLPTDEHDEDTYCVGLAFDLNNTALIPGADPASPKINPMPRMIAYTSDSLLLPFALIDSVPDVKCGAVGNAVELPSTPANLRSIQSASIRKTEVASLTADQPDKDTAAVCPKLKVPDLIDHFNSNGRLSPGQTSHRLSMSTSDQQDLSGSNIASKESDHEALLQPIPEDSNLHQEWGEQFAAMSTGQGKFESSSSMGTSQDIFGEAQPFDEVKSFLDNFSFKEGSEGCVRQSTEGASDDSSTDGPDCRHIETRATTIVQAKPKISLAPFLDVAAAEANDGELFGLLKSILTEMSEELRVSAEAEQMVSKEIASQKDAVVLSISETRELLSSLLQLTRTLFRNETNLRSSVSRTLTEVLSLSREFEKMSLEFRVKEADGFSRCLRAEEKEFDEKITSKEAEVLRSLSSIEERLNAEAEIQTRKRSPAEVVQQVYSSLSLQGIRIKRVRSLLAALNERMDNQDKGGRLSHLGLSLARLEKLNIHDEEIPNISPDKSKRRESAGREATGTPNIVNDILGSEATNNQGDDTQLLPSDVRTVMRRLAMRAGRANIGITVPQSRTKRGRTVAVTEGVSVTGVHNVQKTEERGNGTGQETSGLSSSTPPVSRSLGFGARTGVSFLKTDGINASEFPNPTGGAIAKTFEGNNLVDEIVTGSQSLEPDGEGKDLDSTTTSSKVSAVRNDSVLLKESTLPFAQQPPVQSASATEKVQFASLPPKRPLRQPLYPPSAGQNRPFESLEDSTKCRKEQGERSELALEPSSLPFLDGQETTNGKIAYVKSTPKGTSEAISLSNACSFSTRTENISTVASLSILGTQTSNRLSTDGRLSSTGHPLEVVSHADDPKSSTSAAVQIANLPPDDDEGKHKPSTPKPSPSDEHEAPREGPMCRHFAALPPDSDRSTTRKETSDDNVEIPLPARETKKAPAMSELFAILPPHPEASAVQKQVKQDNGEKEALGSIDRPSSPSRQKETLTTSDLLASLPPDDSTDEPVRPKNLDVASPFQSEAQKTLQKGDDKAAISSSAMDDNDSSLRIEHPPTSIFGGATRSGSAASANADQFVSAFGALKQSNAAFGSSAVFGASAAVNQSVIGMATAERQSSGDGTSDDSEEESTRFGGGMDTSSGGTGFFGASSSTQGNQQSFGFGPKSDGTASVTAFGQSSASPFGALSQSQSFGQSTLSHSHSQAQMGFGSLAASQQSVPSAFQNAQPAFGAASAFGANNAAPAFGMESAFGAASPLGASSSFGLQSQLGAGSTPFGSSSGNPNFGGGMSSPAFGESSFGMTSSFGSFSQNSAGIGFGNAVSTSGPSPFGNVTGSGGVEGASHGGSGFAALAGGQSGPLVFGNGGGPPSFTSAAFSQRRA